VSRVLCKPLCKGVIPLHEFLLYRWSNIWFYDVIYADGRFVAAGNAIYLSPNGVDWSFASYGFYTGIAYGNGRFVAVGDNGTIFTSRDGVKWMVWTLPITKILSGIA